jgi:hypothetical protein
MLSGLLDGTVEKHWRALSPNGVAMSEHIKTELPTAF